MIIDVHTHIFPKKIRKGRHAFFDGEPAFRLLYDSKNAKMVGASEMVAAMDEEGVDLSVVFGFPWADMETARRHNDYILEAAGRYPGRLKGFCCVSPMHPEAPAEVDRCLAAGLDGVGELAFYTGGIDAVALDRLDPVMSTAKENDCPVLIHTNEPVGHIYPGKTPNTLKQIYDMIAAFPENRIILAHWGGGLFFFSLLKKAVKQALENVWFDTAASPFLWHPSIYRYAAETVGIEKILLGTDFPLIPPSRYFDELAASGLNAGEIAAVCGGNAEKLLPLS